MGTRHLTAAVIDGEYKIAQYGQWDGYPSGQGATLLAFLSAMDTESFKRKLRGCAFLPDEEITALWKSEGADDSGFVSMEVSERFKAKYPQLSRDTGSEVFHLVAGSESGLPLRNSIGFAGDSLFCEYAYVVDFDKGTFEAYQGFNKEPLASGERFANAPLSKDGAKYHPVKLVFSWPLSALPTRAELEAAFGADDEES